MADPLANLPWQAFLCIVFVCSLEPRCYDGWRDVSSGQPWMISSISTFRSLSKAWWIITVPWPIQSVKSSDAVMRLPGSERTFSNTSSVHTLLSVWDWLHKAAIRGRVGGQRTPSWLQAPWADWLTAFRRIIIANDLSIKLVGIQVGPSESQFPTPTDVHKFNPIPLQGSRFTTTETQRKSWPCEGSGPAKSWTYPREMATPQATTEKRDDANVTTSCFIPSRLLSPLSQHKPLLHQKWHNHQITKQISGSDISIMMRRILTITVIITLKVTF